MQPWEANDIDQAFKQAAENADFPYEPGSWAALNGRLVSAQRAAMRVKVIAIGSILFLLTVAGYLLFDGINSSIVQKSSKESEDQKITTSVIEKNTSGNENLAEFSQTQDLPSNNTSTNIDNKVNSGPPLENSSNDKDEDPGGNTSTLKTSSPTVDIPSKVADSSGSYLAQKELKVNRVTTPQDWEPNGRATSNLLRNNPNTLIDFMSLPAKRTALPSQIFVVNDNRPLSTKNVDITQVKTIRPNSNRGSRFSIGVSLAPDFSGVSFKGNKAGFGIGATVAYSLSRKFSLSGGLFYARKNYGIKDELGSYGYLWSQIQKPQGIDAQCQVFEIPINLRFNLISTPKNSVFISSGLSTYFMKRENYVFTYTSEGPNAVPGIDIKGENNHIMSIYNLSFGIQRRLTDRFGLEIEPYLKVPIAGIGLWDVNLTSSGAIVTARYFFR